MLAKRCTLGQLQILFTGPDLHPNVVHSIVGATCSLRCLSSASTVWSQNLCGAGSHASLPLIHDPDVLCASIVTLKLKHLPLLLLSSSVAT